MLQMGFPRPKRRRRSYRGILLAAVVLWAVALLAAFFRPSPAEETYAAAAAVKEPDVQAPAAELPASVRKGLPKGWPLISEALDEPSLWAGKMLLIDRDHPVPPQAPPPNTLSVAAMGEGQIAVRSPAHVTGVQVIAALKELFAMGRGEGVTCWLLWEGSRSFGQQLELQIERLRQYAQSMTLTAAAERTAMEVPAPGYSEHQLPFAVDIRIAREWNMAPDQEPLSDSPEGRLLLKNAWRFGFIHRYGEKTAPPYEDEAYHFRYVGVAHSTVMRALNLDFEGYLTFLHGEGAITYYQGETPRYAILCGRADSGLSFSVPEGCELEGSMDNTGYVVVAVTFPKAGR